MVALLSEEGAPALPSRLLRVVRGGWAARVLALPQDVNHIMVAEVHRFIQRRVAPSVTRTTALESKFRSLTRPSNVGSPVFGYRVHSASIQEEAHGPHVPCKQQRYEAMGDSELRVVTEGQGCGFNAINAV